MSIFRIAFSGILIVAVPSLAATATCSSDTLKVLQKGTTTKGQLKETINVVVDGLRNCLKLAGNTTPKFVLYLDGKPVKGLQVTLPDANHEHLQFFLDLISDNPDNKAAWNALLRNPTLSPRRIPLSVGVEDGPPAATEVSAFQLVVINPLYLTGWTILFLLLLGLFWWAAVASDIVRESGPQPASGKRKAYSLARCQMAFWFFLIAMSFALIFMTTWSPDSISQGALILMGISAGTGLAAAVVDTSKNGAFDSQKKDLLTQKASLDGDVQNLQNTIASAAAGTDIAALKQQIADKQKASAEVQAKINQVDAQLATPESEGIIKDLLCDATGMSFHRFQIVVWTLILGIVFVSKVPTELSMPDFSATLLGLMGISSGTYIGFKFPEQKN